MLKPTAARRACLALTLAGIVSIAQGCPSPAPAFVVGYVLDAGTGTPIEGALVRVESAIVQTAMDGLFVIPVDPGHFSLVASADGYQPNSLSIRIESANVEGVTIELAPEGCAVPSAAAELKVTPGPSGNSVLLAWNPVAGATSYRVYQSTLDGAANALPAGLWSAATSVEILLPQAQSSAKQPVVDCNGGDMQVTTYYFWVAARNECGQGPFAGPVTYVRLDE